MSKSVVCSVEYIQVCRRTPGYRAATMKHDCLVYAVGSQIRGTHLVRKAVAHIRIYPPLRLDVGSAIVSYLTMLQSGLAVFAKEGD